MSLVIPTFEKIFSLDSLLISWQEFIKGKKAKKDVAEFSLHLFSNLKTLHEEITAGKYEHGGYNHFVVSDPKQRDIHKALVRDRIIHHALYKALYPYFNQKFIVENIYNLYWANNEFRVKLLNRLNDLEFQYLVAEENGNIVGVLGFRKAPTHMLEFTKTKNPVELYAMAVKHKEKGIGKKLIEQMIKTTKDLGYTELVLYSSESHKESWSFYDHLGFERMGSAQSTTPNKESGHIWRVLLSIKVPIQYQTVKLRN